jgi:hypothetical protein
MWCVHSLASFYCTVRARSLSASRSSFAKSTLPGIAHRGRCGPVQVRIFLELRFDCTYAPLRAKQHFKRSKNDTKNNWNNPGCNWSHSGCNRRILHYCVAHRWWANPSAYGWPNHCGCDRDNSSTFPEKGEIRVKGRDRHSSILDRWEKKELKYLAIPKL